MTWTVKFTKQAEKQFNKLDRPMKQGITAFLIKPIFYIQTFNTRKFFNIMGD